MAYCKNCGEQIGDKTVLCSQCGVVQGNLFSGDREFLWGLLGCCIPLVGLILFLVWKDTKPKSSKAAGIGALVGVISIVLWYVALFVIGLGTAFIGTAFL